MCNALLCQVGQVLRFLWLVPEIFAHSGPNASPIWPEQVPGFLIESFCDGSELEELVVS